MADQRDDTREDTKSSATQSHRPADAVPPAANRELVNGTPKDDPSLAPESGDRKATG